MYSSLIGYLPLFFRYLFMLLLKMPGVGAFSYYYYYYYYYYSRSYAEDVTSVTSGASQGPHSFNLVFVCLFVSRLALSRICTVLYRTSKDSWLLYVCLFVPSTCLALSPTCPVPSRVRYHQENEIMRSVSGECIQCSNILCGFVCEAENPLAGWLVRLSTSPGIACRLIA